MRRVVVTGLGITSCLGLDAEAVTHSLRTGTSGITANPTYAELGMRSQVSGSIALDLSEQIDRKLLRFMGDAAAYAYLSLRQAIEDAGLTEAEVSHPKTGLVMGSGGASSASQVEAADILRERGVKRVGPYRVTQTMGSTVSANLATAFQIKGINTARPSS
jgi:3-oxoacyl-(acyl-carrier-protein) synthase